MKLIGGSCLCGEVRFECKDRFSAFHLCHCTQCQKTTGSAHVSNLFTDGDNITWVSGEETIQRYDLPGRAITNAFCGKCGSPVPYLSTSGNELLVPAGCLDGAPTLAPQDNIFWSERAKWYDEGVKSKKFERFPD